MLKYCNIYNDVAKFCKHFVRFSIFMLEMARFLAVLSSASIEGGLEEILYDTLLGRSSENLFVDQSNFLLNYYADRQPSSRNTHQEYSFHLYNGGTSPPK